MTTTSTVETRPRLLALFGLLTVAVHLAVGKGYGYFRDEFYYLACSDHLAWGYVDHPPFSILMLWISRRLLGDSVVAIRVLPALAGAATLCLGGWMAGAMGGGRFARILAMTAMLVAPLYLGITGFYSMNAFDLLFWAIAACLLILVLKGGGTRHWLLLGLLLGCGLLNKISVLWLGFGLFAGLLLTPQRRFLTTRGPWLAGVVSSVVFLPHVLWQMRNGWPTLEFIHNATTQKMVATAPIDFLSSQIRMMNPLSLPIWLAGLVFLLAGKEGRRFRILGIIYLTVFLLLVVNRASRPGYLGPAYTMLLAAGGTAIEGWVSRVRPRLWLQGGMLTLLVASGAVLAPLALPILPVETYIRYARLMGVVPSTSEKKKVGPLSQHYADMFGWDSLVRTVIQVYGSLPPDDRAVAGIYASNYGEAGAIDLLGRRDGLPPAISGHNNYWLWGTRGYSGQVMIVLGGTAEDHLEEFERVEQAATADCDYCMPYEDDLPIYICRGLRRPIAEIWPEVKHFD